MLVTLLQRANTVTEGNFPVSHKAYVVQNPRTFDKSFPSAPRATVIEQIFSRAPDYLIWIGMHEFNEICAAASVFPC